MIDGLDKRQKMMTKAEQDMEDYVTKQRKKDAEARALAFTMKAKEKEREAQLARVEIER